MNQSQYTSAPELPQPIDKSPHLCYHNPIKSIQIQQKRQVLPMLRIYPVTPQPDFLCTDYAITVNGIPAAPDSARVSAVPYNRRWPGHQRTLDQTELVNFLSLTHDEPVTYEITPAAPWDTAMDPAKLIRPRSLGIVPEITPDGKIRFTMEVPAYFTVEPHGRQRALHIFADPAGIYDVDLDNPQTIYYGPGLHEVGQIELRSGDTLFLDEGAVVYACITAMDVENIRILGRGILDNSHNKAQILWDAAVEGNDEAVNNAVRQHTVQLEYCKNVEIDGITIRDSLVYNIRPIGCRGLTIRNVKLIGCWRFNSDGIDMHNCEDVLIEHCFLRTFDDSICIKGFDCYYDGDVETAVYNAIHHNGDVYDVFKRVVVRDCVIWNDWGKCLEIGAETRAEEIADILFEDCDCIHVTGPVLDCCNVDYADVHHVTWRNIRVELDEVIPQPRYQWEEAAPYGEIEPGHVPPVIYGEVSFHHEYSAGGTRRGINRDLLFEEIRILTDNPQWQPWFGFNGYSEDYGCRDVLIRDAYINGRKLPAGEGYSLGVGQFCENIRYEATEA